MMRVLVTGAAGFAGRHLLRQLRASAPDALLFGLTRRVPEVPLPADAVLLQADLGCPGTLFDAVREAAPDQVYHLAAHASAGGGDREAIFRANVLGTRHLLEAVAALSSPVAVLLASTGYVYGCRDESSPACEEDPLDPRGDYAESKAAMEALVEEYATAPLRIVVTRAFNHTGPGQSDRYVVPAFARQIAEVEAGARPPVLEVGWLESRRDFCDVRDVVRGYRLALAAGTHGERFNVCSGRAVSVRQILEWLLRLSGASILVRPDPARQRASDLPVNAGSPRKLMERTGWRPKRDLATTLADVLAQWRGDLGGARRR